MKIKFDEYKVDFTIFKDNLRKTERVLIDSQIQGGDAIMEQIKFELCISNSITQGDILLHSLKKIKS